MNQKVMEYLSTVDHYAEITYQRGQMELHAIPVVEKGNFPLEDAKTIQQFYESLVSITLWYDVQTNSFQYYFVANPFFKEVLILESVDKEVLDYLASSEDREDPEEGQLPDTENVKYLDFMFAKRRKADELP